ncbi:unnamed protein product [Amoebophrya sp. A25]|nr:unnamed protein product [Amoebophrya sp. A25]|eukprot:GSA25T00002390001.1
MDSRCMSRLLVDAIKKDIWAVVGVTLFYVVAAQMWNDEPSSTSAFNIKWWAWRTQLNKETRRGAIKRRKSTKETSRGVEAERHKQRYALTTMSAEETRCKADELWKKNRSNNFFPLPCL